MIIMFTIRWRKWSLAISIIVEPGSGERQLPGLPGGKIASLGQISMMTPEQLIDRRKRFRMTQTEMAKVLGLTLRGYQKLEAQDEPIRPAYEMAIAFLALQKAVELKDRSLASKLGRKVVEDFAKMEFD